MAGIWTMGELLVEIMRPKAGMELYEPGEFLGPFPSGAPAIFIDTVARLGGELPEPLVTTPRPVGRGAVEGVGVNADTEPVEATAQDGTRGRCVRPCLY